MGKYQDNQRALVLQVEAHLCAYEAGAYQALYEKVTKRQRKKEKKINHF